MAAKFHLCLLLLILGTLAVQGARLENNLDNPFHVAAKRYGSNDCESTSGRFCNPNGFCGQGTTFCGYTCGSYPNVCCCMDWVRINLILTLPLPDKMSVVSLKVFILSWLRGNGYSRYDCRYAQNLYQLAKHPLFPIYFLFVFHFLAWKHNKQYDLLAPVVVITVAESR